jgi:phage baseplate assembly protein W
MPDGTQARPQLGTGWPFPVRPRGGDLAFVRGELLVEQSIGLILETCRRERVMQPGFGAGLRDFVFAPNSPQVQRAVESDVRESLIAWEPRINVEGVRARSAADRPNVLLIEIDYVVRQNNAFYNLVYPFFLTQRT